MLKCLNADIHREQASHIDCSGTSIKQLNWRCLLLMIGTGISTLRGIISTLRGIISTLRGIISILRGIISTLRGIISTLRGIISTLRGIISTRDLQSCLYGYTVSTIVEASGRVQKDQIHLTDAVRSQTKWRERTTNKYILNEFPPQDFGTEIMEKTKWSLFCPQFYHFLAQLLMIFLHKMTFIATFSNSETKREIA